MSLLRVYKSTMPSLQVIFGDGKVAVFQQGVYRTDSPQEIGTLDSEVSKHHPHIFIDPNEREIDSEMLDPMVALRASVRAELIAEANAAMAAAINPDRELGTSDQSGSQPSNTRDLMPVTIGSNSGATLANLVAKTAAAVK